MATLPQQFETLDPKTITEWNLEFKNYKKTSAELSGLVTQLSIFESIYNNCMFGNIKIQDGTGFVEGNGIVGSGVEEVHFELLTINTGTAKTANLEKDFRINSISGGIKNPKFTEYDIGIASKYLFINNKKKISRSYLKMTASEIVSDVGANILEFGSHGIWTDLKLTPTLHEKNTVVPNWNPFQLINFLARNSVSADGASDYLFFENNDGFKFQTIDELKAGDIKRFLTLKNMPVKMIDDIKGFSVDDAMMENYVEQSRFNLSNGQMNGTYGGSILTHNILEKKLEEFTVEYDAEKHKIVAEGIGLNGPPGAPFTDFNVWQHTGFMSSNYLYAIHDKGEYSHYPWHDMKKAELRSNLIKFDIPGDSNIFAGDILQLRIPTHIHTHDIPEDQYLTGNWLVTAIHHKISPSGYTQTLECMKDGFYSDPDITIPARAW